MTLKELTEMSKNLAAIKAAINSIVMPIIKLVLTTYLQAKRSSLTTVGLKPSPDETSLKTTMMVNNVVNKYITATQVGINAVIMVLQIQELSRTAKTPELDENQIKDLIKVALTKTFKNIKFKGSGTTQQIFNKIKQLGSDRLIAAVVNCL